MKIRPGCAQHMGSRKDQQDSFGFSQMEQSALVKRAGALAVLADGMGGLAMGKEAGAAAVKAVLSAHESATDGQSPIAILEEAVAEANKNVLDMAVNAGVEGEAGSTLVAVIIKDSHLYWTSVGDSRIYLYRLGELVQLTMDQNYSTDLLRRVADGQISKAAAKTDPDRAGLTNFIGNPHLNPADSSLRPFPLQNGDWVLLCSDGLYGTLTHDEICEQLSGHPNDACESLVRETISRNKSHQDNVTVSIVAYGDREPITVKTKKITQNEEIFAPMKERSFSIKVIVLLIAGFLVFAIAGYSFSKYISKPEPLPAALPVQSIKADPENKQPNGEINRNTPTKPVKNKKDNAVKN